MIKGKKVAKKTSLPEIGDIFRWEFEGGFVYHITISKDMNIGLNNTMDNEVDLHRTDWWYGIDCDHGMTEIIESLDEGRDE